MPDPIEAPTLIDIAAREGLSIMEVQVLQLTGEGHQAKTIASVLYKSTRTIEAARRRILQKLNAQSLAHAVLIACRKGLIK